MNGTVNPGQSTRAVAADLGVDQSTVVRARRGAEASPETVTGRRSNLSAAPRLRQVDSPRVLPGHYPVGCCRDGGENADGAEPAAGRAKQHLSESTDTNTECRDAYPRIPDPGRGRETDRGCQIGSPRPPGRYADPGCFPARLAGCRDRRSGVVAGRVEPQSGTARPQGEER